MKSRHSLQTIPFVCAFMALLALNCNLAQAQTDAPVAQLGGYLQNRQGVVPFEAILSAEGSVCRGGSCRSVLSWGDGQFIEYRGLPGDRLFHLYEEPGTYIATLSVTNAAGLTATANTTLKVAEGETLSKYVAACQAQLGFDELPDFNCYDGRLFAEETTFIRDFVGYERITENVDLAFACRWLFGSKEEPRSAESVEMWVHNRENGATCFFAAKEEFNRAPSYLPSPTSPLASATWKQPAELDYRVENNETPPGGHLTHPRLRCVGCHTAGPVIASSRIAKDLAYYGLLNNGHDTLNERYHAVTTPGGSAFDYWNDIIEENKSPHQETCAEGCHSIAEKSITPTIRPPQTSGLLPSILSVISDHYDYETMPPNYEDSPFRWINDGALNSQGDRESFASAKENYPAILEGCDLPLRMEVQVVGSPVAFEEPTTLPSKLEYFNLEDGLKCNNTDQPGGTCADYRTSYLCEGEWLGPFNMDTPGYDGDDESRWKIPGLCESPTAIRAVASFPGSDALFASFGPSDRLEELSPKGLTCKNADQSDGQCANYVVRYRDCIDLGEPGNIRLTNAWSGRLLTLSGYHNDAATRAQPANASWPSQDWTIEPIEGSEHVRFRNKWNGRYLNVQPGGENALVTAHDLVPEWLSMQWVLENTRSGVRIRNVWSGRYLTAADNSDFSAVISKTLNTSWSSQIWQL